MKRSNNSTISYIDGPWIIDIVDNGKEYETWIRLNNIGIAMHCFSIDKNNVELSDYIDITTYAYMDYTDYYNSKYND